MISFLSGWKIHPVGTPFARVLEKQTGELTLSALGEEDPLDSLIKVISNER